MKSGVSHLCLSVTSPKVIEEPYRTSAHCFNAPVDAHFLDNCSSVGAERGVSVG